MTRHIMITLGALGLGSAIWFGGFEPPAGAQPRGVVIDNPHRCDRGDVLTFTGNGRARCVSFDSLIPSCSEGEFLTAQSGTLRCSGATTGFSHRGLLPDCSSGNRLVSEGFGRWRCADEHHDRSLPRCSSGEVAISEGSSGWRCGRCD